MKKNQKFCDILTLHLPMKTATISTFSFNHAICIHTLHCSAGYFYLWHSIDTFSDYSLCIGVTVPFKRKH